MSAMSDRSVKRGHLEGHHPHLARAVLFEVLAERRVERLKASIYLVRVNDRGCATALGCDVTVEHHIAWRVRHLSHLVMKRDWLLRRRLIRGEDAT